MIFNFIAYLLGYGLIIVIGLFLLIGVAFALTYSIIIAVDWCISVWKKASECAYKRGEKGE